MIFETHAHYDDPCFDEDRETLLSSLLSMGIGPVVNIAADVKSLDRVRELAGSHPNLYCTLGLHPSEVEEASEEVMERIARDFKEDPRALAVGEIGLDYHWPEPDPEKQKYWFARQLRLAGEADKPVVIHSRDAAEDTIRILRENHAEELGGVIHCYSYGPEETEAFLEMGFYFGIGGVLTFKNAKKLKEACRKVPLSRIVLETDCPYLSPEPHRGKRNDSRNLPLVVKALAELKGVVTEEVERVTFNNARKLYRLER